MKFANENLVFVATLLLAGGKGVGAVECEVSQCWEPRGGDLPNIQVSPFCFGSNMQLNYEGQEEVCRCMDDGCDTFEARCKERGWLVHTLGGCSCTEPSSW